MSDRIQVIVIDVGCARYGGDYSIERLIEEFYPEVLYGFDPNPATTDKPVGECEAFQIEDTLVFVERMAAWTHDGEIGYHDDGLNSWVTERQDAKRVRCFDLAGFIAKHEGKEIVLKIDAETAEYALLEHLIAKGADRLLKLAWIEWHSASFDFRGRRAWIEANIACEIQEWRW